MEDVTVDKADLLEALRKNREGHRSDFLAAQEGWRATVIDELDRRLKDARNGKAVRAIFSFPEPEDHTKDYDRIIRMVEMEVRTNVVLLEHDFARYVMDDWEWKANWTASNLNYVGRAAKL